MRRSTYTTARACISCSESRWLGTPSLDTPPRGARWRRGLHSSRVWAAVALPGAAPGPPPKAPVPAGSAPEERQARRKRQAELLELGRQLKAGTGTLGNSQSAGMPLQKRFWRDVAVVDAQDGYNVMLDSRPVRTATKRVLTIPRSKRALAVAIALEWDQLVSASQALKQHYIPLTALASRAMDIAEADAAEDASVREKIATVLLRYLSTDTLLCWAPEKSGSASDGENDNTRAARSLRQLQMQTAQPIVQFLSQHVWPGVELNPVLDAESIIPTAHPESTTQVVAGWIHGLPPFELAALERAVLASKSLCVATRLVVEWSQEFAELAHTRQDGTPRFTVEDAAQACSLEVSWQTGMWGEVEDSHDVDKEDLRRQLGGAVLLVDGSKD